MGTLASCAASGLCCCFSCCCQQCSDALKGLLGKERLIKLFYILLIIVFAVPAIIFFFFINRWASFLDYFSFFMKCPNGTGFECIGASGVYRISLSLLILFVLMMILMVCRNRCSMVINEGFFCFKYLGVIGVFIAFLWVSNSVFNDYAQASKYLSIVYLVLQSIILIDLFYLAGINLVKRYDNGESGCGAVLIILTIIAEGLAIALNIVGYTNCSSLWNNNTQLCGSTLWVNIITSIIIIALPVLQLFHFNHQNSLLTTALVTVYISYLSFISQFNYNLNSSPTCNRTTVSSLIFDVICSTFFFFIGLYGTIMGGSGQVKVTANGDINKAVGVAPTEMKEEEPKKYSKQQQQHDPDVAPYQSWKWVQYHFNMAFASVYIGMLITNWTSADLTTGTLQSDSFGFWVRVAIAWVTTVLYIWTLIAPKVCPDRDFTVQ